MQSVKTYIWSAIYWLAGRLSPKMLVSIHFRRAYGYWLDWKHPKDINEKINWLKFYGDTSRWTDLADKYRVRDYVTACGLGDMLVPLLGKWDKARDIDWNKLPSQFVMKTNHGSGDALICRDKALIDTAMMTQQFDKLLHQKFGQTMGEPHYNRISPCIIAEKLLDNSQQKVESTSLVDYKIWTFDGKPAYIWACHNRTKHSCNVGVYDLDWNFHPEYSNSTSHYVLSSKPIPRPDSLEQMLEAAAILSKGFPELRVDFYEVEGKPYFGELTFTSASGFNSFYTPEFRRILGDMVKID